MSFAVEPQKTTPNHRDHNQLESHQHPTKAQLRRMSGYDEQANALSPFEPKHFRVVDREAPQQERFTGLTKHLHTLFERYVDRDGSSAKAEIGVKIPVAPGAFLTLGLETEATRDDGLVGLSGKLTIGGELGLKALGLDASAAISGSIGVKASSVKELMNALKYAAYRTAASSAGGTRNRLANWIIDVDADTGERAAKGEQWARAQERALFGENSKTEVAYGLSGELGFEAGEVGVKGEYARMQTIDKDVLDAVRRDEADTSSFGRHCSVVRSRNILTHKTRMSNGKRDALYHRLALEKAMKNSTKYEAKMEFEVFGVKAEVAVEWPKGRFSERKVTVSLAHDSFPEQLVGLIPGPIALTIGTGLGGLYEQGGDKGAKKSGPSDAGAIAAQLQKLVENGLKQGANKITLEREYKPNGRHEDSVEMSKVRSLSADVLVASAGIEKTDRIAKQKLSGGSSGRQTSKAQPVRVHI